MRLILLVALTLTAFAANSVLNRMAVDAFGMDAFRFAAVRVGAGAVTLGLLVALRRQNPFAAIGTNWRGALALALYMLGFSWAYQSLGAGIGALILFGSLQLMMFGWAVFQGQSVRRAQWIGMGVALIGLLVLLWPAADVSVPMLGTGSMLAATLGWAAYTILGQGSRDALAQSAGNFILCLPIVLLPLAVTSGGYGGWQGITCAVLAGSVSSGLGYALWYRVLPHLATTQAGLAQLAVPVIAVLGGAALLAEPVTGRMALAALLVLGGIALSIGPKAPTGRS